MIFTLLMVLHTLLMKIHTLFLVLRIVLLMMHTLFLVLRTLLMPPLCFPQNGGEVLLYVDFVLLDVKLAPQERYIHRP